LSDVVAAVDVVTVAMGKIPAPTASAVVLKKRKRGEEEAEGTVGAEYGKDTTMV
jgi:hypothetical protein